MPIGWPGRARNLCMRHTESVADFTKSLDSKSHRKHIFYLVDLHLANRERDSKMYKAVSGEPKTKKELVDEDRTDHSRTEVLTSCGLNAKKFTQFCKRSHRLHRVPKSLTSIWAAALEAMFPIW
jgi:deoxyribodipyrimidine photolyase